MKYYLYRWFMSFAHRHGWHKMDEFHPDGDTLLWCQWCGLRVVTKRNLTQRVADEREDKQQTLEPANGVVQYRQGVK